MSEASFPEIAPLPAVMGMKDVCDLIGITSETARRLINDGALPGHRVPGGRQWVFRTEEVLAAISSWAALVDGEQSRGAGDDRGNAAPAVTPTTISCLAPQRSPDQTELEWLGSCGAHWIQAAAESGLAAAGDGEGAVRVGPALFQITVEESEVVVVDDLGDERTDAYVVVSVVPAPPSGGHGTGVTGVRR